MLTAVETDEKRLEESKDRLLRAQKYTKGVFNLQKPKDKYSIKIFNVNLSSSKTTCWTGVVICLRR